MKHFTKTLMCLLLVLLLAAAALTGCAQTEPTATEAPKTEAPQTQAQTDAPQTEAPKTEAQVDVPKTDPPQTEAAPAEPVELGEGDKLFYFDVTFSNGETSSYAIHTDAETVGEALVSLELIAGDESEYGLYVKTIGDETLDYATDGMYWAFYENGEYLMTGVDATPIAEGHTYAFVASK